MWTHYFIRDLAAKAVGNGQAGVSLLDRWSYPFLRWHTRPGVDASAKAAIKNAQKQFANDVNSLVDDYNRLGRKPDKYVQDMFDRYVHEFFVRTQAHEYY